MPTQIAKSRLPPFGRFPIFRLHRAEEKKQRPRVYHVIARGFSISVEKACLAQRRPFFHYSPSRASLPTLDTSTATSEEPLKQISVQCSSLSFFRYVLYVSSRASLVFLLQHQSNRRHCRLIVFALITGEKRKRRN